MKLVPILKSKTTSVHLEQARLRIRNRFQSNFPTISSAGSRRLHDPLLFVNKKAMNVIVPSSATASSMHLEAARARLHNNFAVNFPVAQSLGDHHQPVSASRASLNRTTDHLQVARANIHHRFQTKFLPEFTGFPSTLRDAMVHFEDEDWGKNHAVIITNTSHQILAVNTCWQDLCGYSAIESVGQTVQSLGLSGPFTSRTATRTLVHDLEHNQQAAAFVTNKTKGGRLFTNYLRVKPLYADHSNRDDASAGVVAFLGVVQEAAAASSHVTSKAGMLYANDPKQETKKGFSAQEPKNVRHRTMRHRTMHAY
jgi:PAS domain S-box-containing protein